MLKRQRVLIQLIREVGGTVDKLVLVKLGFLLAQEAESRDMGAFYHFVPYKFGPFSFAMFKELASLEARGFLSISKNELELDLDLELKLDERRVGEVPEVEAETAVEVARLVKRYRHRSKEALLDEVYADYPWYALLSERKGVVKQRRPEAEVAIYTVGYEKLDIDELLGLLLEKGIRRVIDVRKNPLSRQYGFHKSTLSRHLDSMGIGYVHVPELGIDSSWRAELDTLADYEAIFRRYESEVLPTADARGAIAAVAGLMSDTPSVLLCQEADPRYCHRTCVARAVSRQVDLELDIHDLREGTAFSPLVSEGEVVSA
jgi:uncharacterized protein (DUF488 family)